MSGMSVCRGEATVAISLRSTEILWAGEAKGKKNGKRSTEMPGHETIGWSPWLVWIYCENRLAPSIFKASDDENLGFRQNV